MKNSRIVLAVLTLIALAATGYSVSDTTKAAKAGLDCCAAGEACCDGGSCCGK